MTVSAVPLILQSLDGLLAGISQVVCDGTKFRGFSPEMSDEILETMAQKLSLVQSYMNTIHNSRRSPICSLPPEVLDLILRNTLPSPPIGTAPHFPPLQYDAAQDLSELARIQSWHPVRLTAVCRYWKAVTLLSPSIWTNINVGRKGFPNASAELAQLCLRRSYGASIDVYIWDHLPEELMPWVTETLASQSMRFRTFHLSGFSFDGTLLAQFTECPAPLLNNLLIWPMPMTEDHSAASHVRLPLIFAGYMPNLRSLSLSNIEIWPANNFANLRTLHLRNSAQGLTYAEFFDFLRSNPCLEELVLEWSGPGGDYLVPTDLQVSLPHLNAIKMVKVPSMCVARLLAHIKPSQILSLHLSRLPFEGLRPASVLASVSRLDALHQISRLVLDTELADGQVRRRLSIAGYGLSQVELIGAGADAHEMASNQYMGAAVEFITACDIRELWVKSNDDVIVREELWQRLLFAMPSIAKLTLGPYFGQQRKDHSPPRSPMSPLGGSGLLSALYSGDESVGRALPCPSLKELILFGHITLGMYATSDYSSAEIRQFLEQRKSRGFPLARVVFVEIHSCWTRRAQAVCAQYASELRDLVEDVQIDLRPALQGMTAITQNAN